MADSVAAAPAKAQAFAALHNRDYRAYFGGWTLTMMGDNIEHVISYWVLFQTFHSPALAGFAVISHWAPYLVLRIYFGALADRYDCRKLIAVSQMTYLLSIGVLGRVVLHGHAAGVAGDDPAVDARAGQRGGLARRRS